MLLSADQKTISAAARSSPLSKKQVAEVEKALNAYFPGIKFEPIWIDTTGDLDQNTSLRALDKTNFFTKEIDTLLLERKCRIAIHSAKDLPDPLPQGLALIALTIGVDPSDSLVLRQGAAIETLPSGSTIATSSQRREEAVAALRSDLVFVDIRGAIEKRLQALEEKKVDGVVVAEAALIRLELTHLNRVVLPGYTAALQGQLAVVAHAQDLEMIEIFACIDSRVMQ